MNRLFDIAYELNELAKARFDLKQQLETIARNIKTQEAAIIPAGGWPGSNADTRKAAETAAKAADPALQMFAADKAAIEEALDKLELDRDALLAEKEAWHWTIRDRETQCSMIESVFDAMQRHLDGMDGELKASIEQVIEVFGDAQHDTDDAGDDGEEMPF